MSGNRRWAMLGGAMSIGLAAGISTAAASMATATGAAPSSGTAASDTPAGTITADQACARVTGKSVDGAKLTAVMVEEKAGIPSYCKITGLVTPSLNFEVRLPARWNGKLYYGGGGGYNGTIPPVSAAPLRQGFAMVASDSGHQGDGMSAAFISGNDEAAELFGSKSVPEVTAIAVKILTLAYGSPPVRRYFEGCSTGGREALMAVQRNPNLFDGVIVRAPAYNWVGLMGKFNQVATALAAPGGSLPPAKTAFLADHVRRACDALDGIVDGVVANSAACTAKRLNIAGLRCVGGKDTGNNCLSDPQLTVVKAWTTDISYANGAYTSNGYNLTGNEDDPMNFNMWVAGNGDVRMGAQFAISDSTLKYYLAHDPRADSLTYSPWDKDRAAVRRMAALNDATQPDIRPFLAHGGKLIFWHGGSDAGLSVNATIAYVTKMRRAVGAARADASTRFYVAPGVNHCEGGPGADETDLLAALDRWSSAGAAPDVLTAVKRDAAGAIAFSRPLCRYPRYPRYIGPSGDAVAARSESNYACTLPPTAMRR